MGYLDGVTSLQTPLRLVIVFGEDLDLLVDLLL
jgi:hypothetical protein